jgi:hypothetical protein
MHSADAAHMAAATRPPRIAITKRGRRVREPAHRTPDR